MYKRAVYRSATMAVRKPEPESPSRFASRNAAVVGAGLGGSQNPHSKSHRPGSTQSGQNTESHSPACSAQYAALASSVHGALLLYTPVGAGVGAGMGRGAVGA